MARCVARRGEDADAWDDLGLAVEEVHPVRQRRQPLWCRDRSELVAAGSGLGRRVRSAPVVPVDLAAVVGSVAEHRGPAIGRPPHVVEMEVGEDHDVDVGGYHAGFVQLVRKAADRQLRGRAAADARVDHDNVGGRANEEAAEVDRQQLLVVEELTMALPRVHVLVEQLSRRDVQLTVAEWRDLDVSDLHFASFQDCSSPVINAVTASCKGVRTPASLPTRTIPPFSAWISVGRLASTSCSMLGLWLKLSRAAWSMTTSGSFSSSMPSASATVRPSATSCPISARTGGSVQICPCVSPVSAASGLVELLKRSFVHWAGRASSSAWVFMPPRVIVSASARTSSGEAGVGSNGPIHVSPGASMCTTPGASTCPAGRHTPRITRGTCSAMTSSLPIPFCTLQTAPSANTCAVAASAGSVNVPFTATIPNSHGAISAASVRASTRAVTFAAPVRRSPSRLIASTCSVETS